MAVGAGNEWRELEDMGGSGPEPGVTKSPGRYGVEAKGAEGRSAGADGSSGAGVCRIGLGAMSVGGNGGALTTWGGIEDDLDG
jgi:hypothetical protein